MRILIVDDHRLFMDGIRLVLEQLDSDAEVVEANRAHLAINLIDRNERFDLILVDLAMPELDGFALLEFLRNRAITTPCIVISGSSDASNVQQCLQQGAMGFIPKSSTRQEMLDGISRVLAGNVFLPTELELAVSQLERQSGGNNGNANGSSSAQIGERQLEVLRLVEQGQSNKQIAAVMNISEATVKSHIGILFRALRVRNRTACVREALKQSLITPSMHT